MKICSVEGCENPSKVRGFCSKCYYRMWTKKQLVIHKKGAKLCSQEGCEYHAGRKGLCRLHYNQTYYKSDSNIGICKFCGKTFIRYRKDKSTCDLKCATKYYRRGAAYQIGTREMWRGETMLVLTKWKWKMVDELLVYRTIHLYLTLCGSCDEHIMFKELDKLIPFCLKSLKEYYEV